MPYVKKITYAGSAIIVEKGFRNKHQAGIKRSKKETPSSEAVQKVNERYAMWNLTVLMNTNFTKDDLHLVFTYRLSERVSPEKSQERLKKALRALRKIYRKSGQELKYIYTTEYKNKAIHHHILVNYFDLKAIASVWPYGSIHPTMIYSDDLSKLAAYFVKETKKTFKDADNVIKQRYVASKNLIRPEPVVELLQSKRWLKTPKPIDGYEIVTDSLQNGVSEVTGIPWQYYIMTVIDTKRCCNSTTMGK